ncbi:MAG: hypothetical protein IJR00_05820, partial [Lachnospiraceae bacterium]|nr:hypothetical protein [Lachnospiraceae bacterium]
WLVSHGIATISSQECAHLFGVPREEVPQRMVRLRKKGQFVALARGLWVAVPAEYREMHAPDPMYYIDDLMSFYGCDYCVGWLSAAALQGARQQAPQVFQLAANKMLRNRVIGRSRLQFFDRSYVSKITRRRITISSGRAYVASPGTTMLMAASDPVQCGGIDNTATIITELAEENTEYREDILKDAPLFSDTAVRRLGWVLEHVAGEDSLDALAKYCERANTPALLLSDGRRSGSIDRRWNIIVNREIEADI